MKVESVTTFVISMTYDEMRKLGNDLEMGMAESITVATEERIRAFISLLRMAGMQGEAMSPQS